MSVFEPRTRFNHGFHDGAGDARESRGFRPGGMLSPKGPHFDKTYERGYRAGYAASREGRDTSSSADAWETRCTCGQALGFHSESCRAQGANR